MIGGAHLPMVLVTLVVGILAIYHLLMGALALFAPARAARAIGALYGASLVDAPQLRYSTSMIGALALAVGGLAAIAAPHPYEHRAIVGALLLLQLARMFCRVRDRRLLAESLGVAPSRNVLMIAVLGLEVAVLALALP